MNYYVYILHAHSADRLYSGQTQDLARRLERHNKGYERSTRHGTPWSLACAIKVTSRSEAIKLERRLKNMKSRKRVFEWIQTLASDQYVAGPAFHRIYDPD